MTVPGTSVSNQWTDFEDLNATILHNRIDAPLIALGSGNSFVRTRTTSLGALSASTDLAIAAWPTSLYATGSFGSYSGSGGTAGQFTFTLAGLYMWVLPVTWPNSGTYKAQAKLLINGAASPDGDNINAVTITSSGASNYTVTHTGLRPAQVGDVWQMAVAASSALSTGMVTPQSWSVVKVA
jgi:hypothetical protein